MVLVMTLLLMLLLMLLRRDRSCPSPIAVRLRHGRGSELDVRLAERGAVLRRYVAVVEDR
jgi:hypothetical protein